MPSYNITESDKSKSQFPVAQSITVFVPGFATKGAINTPTLFDNVDDFEEEFGTSAYEFNENNDESNQSGTLPYSGATLTATEDLSYFYAKSLLENGMSVIYDRVGTSSNVAVTNVSDFYSNVKKEIEKLTDMGEYDVKYITTGAYPSFENTSDTDTSDTDTDEKTLVQTMLEVAEKRGDCTALIDHFNDTSRDLVGDSSVIGALNNSSGGTSSLGDKLKYGAMYTPWVIDLTDVEMPASFAYLRNMAISVKTNADYLAIAGVNRGLVYGIKGLCQNVTNAIADSYSKDSGISINPITKIKPYGYTIWGNRTLKNNTTDGLQATSFMNIRQLVNDIKKVVRSSALYYTFEQNSDALWLNFTASITPTLDRMKANGGINGYKIVKKKADKKATIKAVITLYPVEPVENWEINIELSAEQTAVAE